MKVGELCARLGMDFSQFDKDERTAKSRTQSLGSSLSGIIKNAFSFGLGMTFFSAVQRGFKATVGGAVSFNDTLEQATIGFTTMLGSARRADSFLSDLAKFAAHTPFEFEGLLDASKRMMALGFAAGDVIPTMTAIGDAAAALGSGQEGIDSLITGLGNIKTQGKVTSIAMMQLARAGVPSWQILADAIGKSTGETRKLVEQGLVSADVGIAALTDGMEERFPSMMAKMEDSWRGVTATIKDVWSMTLGEMTKGLFGNATEWLKGIRDTMQGFYDALKAGGLQHAIQQTFGAGVAASVGTLVSALKGLWSMVTGVAGGIVRNWTLIRNLTLGVVWAFASFKIAAFAVGAVTKATSLLALVTGLLRGEAIKTSLTTGFLARVIQTYNLQLHLASMAGIAHVGVLQVLKTAIYSVTAALGTLLWPLLIIGAVLGIGITMWSKYNQAVQASAQKIQAAKMAEQQKAYAESAYEAAEGTDAQADALANLGKAASKNLQSFDEIHSLAADTADLSAGGLGDLLGATPTAPFELPEFDMSGFSFDMDAAIAEAKGNMGGFWGWAWQGFKDWWARTKAGAIEWAQTWWLGVQTIWASFTTWVHGWFDPLWDGVKERWTAFKEWAKEFWAGVQERWGQFKEWFLSWAGPFWDWVKEKWGNFKDWAAELWEGVKTRWGQFKTWFLSWAGPLWDGVKDAWSTFAGWAGRLWDSVKSSWGSFKDWVGRTWDGIVAKFGSLKATLYGHIVQPFIDAKNYVLGIVGQAKEWGKNLIGNFVDGIKSLGSGIKNAVSNVADTIKGWLGFSSPTKEGPGRYADQWAPNLMSMFARGMLDNLGQVRFAASTVSASLASMATMPRVTMPAPVFSEAGLGDSAVSSRFGGIGDSGGLSSRPLTIIVKIGERTIVDQVIEGINDKSRGSGEIVITT